MWIEKINCLIVGCPAGYHGDNCSTICSANYFGLSCGQTCTCLPCHHIYGCNITNTTPTEIHPKKEKSMQFIEIFFSNCQLFQTTVGISWHQKTNIFVCMFNILKWYHLALDCLLLKIDKKKITIYQIPIYSLTLFWYFIDSMITCMIHCFHC